MGILSTFADFSKDIAHGARGFVSGLMDGTTKGNSIGSLVGIIAGAGAFALGLATAGPFIAIATGVGLGAAVGVASGAIIGSFTKAAQNGHTITELEQQQSASTPSTPAQYSTPAPEVPPKIQAPAPVRSAVSYQQSLARERAATAQQGTPLTR